MAQCDKLHGQARMSSVDRRKYCQLSSTDDGPFYRLYPPLLSSVVDCTLRQSMLRAWRNL